MPKTPTDMASESDPVGGIYGRFSKAVNIGSDEYLYLKIGVKPMKNWNGYLGFQSKTALGRRGYVRLRLKATLPPR